MKAKIIVYLHANWKHIAIAALMGMYNICVGAGIVPSQYQNEINFFLAAAGISVVKNSGTTDALNKLNPPPDGKG